MKFGLFVLIVSLGTAGLAAQASFVVPPGPWGASPADAVASARSLGKPVVLLWQAGPGAPAFTQAVEQMLSAWPAWSAQAQLAAVFTRGRSWEAPLPADYPALADPKTSALVVWAPASGQSPTVWTSVPPVLELSRALARASGRPLADPYEVDLTSVEWAKGRLDRLGDGPGWSGTEVQGPSNWVEEGPLGTVLILRDTASGRRAAVPLDGEWSFLYDAQGQSWSPWNPVLVKRR